MNQTKDKEPETVHMSCRSKHPIIGDNHCGGTQAIITSKKRAKSQLASGGSHYASYKCVKCGGSWTVGF